MRRRFAALCIILCLTFAWAPAWAAPAEPPALADVVEYIRLFGYREMLRAGAERQLASIVELVRQTRPEVEPGVLAAIHDELRVELLAAQDSAVREMAGVFQRNMSRQDVAYLIGVGRDPRMQRVVAMQPRLAAELEGVGERLAEEVAAKAAPRIQERLRQLEGAKQL